MEEYRNENYEAMETNVENSEGTAERETERSGNGLGYFILGGLTVAAVGAAVKGGKFIAKKIKEAKAKKSENEASKEAAPKLTVDATVVAEEDAD